MNVTEIVQSPRWKKFMGYVYGWGASIVLIGALFKIQHYPYAGLLLTVGMITEAIIFFFSAFEPPHEQPDWSLVYPELIGLEPREKMGGGARVEGLEQIQSLLERINIEPDKISSLNQGLAKLTNVADNLANLSNAANATDGYIQSMQKASDSVGEFSTKYADSTQGLSDSAQKLSASYQDVALTVADSAKDYVDKFGQSVNDLTGSYKETALTIADSGKNYVNKLDQSVQHLASAYQDTASSISESGKGIADKVDQSVQDLTDTYKDAASSIVETGKNFAGKVDESGNRLLNAYQQIDQSLQTDFGKISENSNNFNSSMQSMNKNLSSLNAIYELQLKQSNEQMGNAKNLRKDLDKVLQTLTATLENAQTYRKETEQLNQNISALNTIYGNMLSAMDHKKKN